MKKILFTLLFALVGLQSAFAAVCAEGTIYFKPPQDWRTAYIRTYNGESVAFTDVDDKGWLSIKSEEFGQFSFYADYAKFFIANQKSDYCYNSNCVTSETWNQTTNRYNYEYISCATPGDLYIFEDPKNPGKTVVSSTPPGAKYFFVMIPPEYEDWMSDVPMISMDGGTTGKMLKAVPDMCGWYYYVFFNEEISDNVVLFRANDDDRVDMIGANGNWETGSTATPIPLSLFFDFTDSLFFVPDEDQKTTEDGFYYNIADALDFEGTCSYTLAALIYDTDASLHPAFSCYSPGGEGCQLKFPNVDSVTLRSAINNCLGVQQGLVEPILNPTTKKPTLSKTGEKCFINKTFFNQLFNYTPGVNERRCYDMPFVRSADNKWEFDSDNYISPGTKATGFYPVEMSGPDAAGDAMVLADDPTQTPVRAARTKRTAEGPVFFGPAFRAIDPGENVPKIDILCNGPGWNRGEDCSGAFNTGTETEMAFAVKFVGGDPKGLSTCVFGWSCETDAPAGWIFYKDGTDIPAARDSYSGSSSISYRWNGERNQHYCFESHAHFTYNRGQRFSFRGDDDIWVYVDNILAVDIGGTHLAAPGYVDLDVFEGQSGKLVPGQQYDIDIFFCDRRTTMSNIRIKTNMYIRQKTAIDIKKTQDKSGNVSYNVCYSRSDDGSCVAALSKIAEVDSVCDEKIPELGINISYTLVQGGSYYDSPIVAGFDNVTTPGVYKCGIDLTNIASPKINASNVCLNGGRYTLFVNIEGKVQKVQSFRVTGDVDVVYEPAVVKNVDGTLGAQYVPQTSAMGGTLVPVYVSAVDKPDTKSALEVLPDEARNISYTLTYSPLMKIYAKNSAGEFVAVNSGTPRVIDMSGVDTVYATVEMADLAQSSQPFTIGVTGRASVMTINFFKPTIMFVDQVPATKTVTGMELNESGRYDELAVGVVYDYYLIAFKPDVNGNITPTPCTTECEGLKVRKAEATSSKIESVNDEAVFKDGYASISVRALGEYRYNAEAEADHPAKIVVEFGGRTVTYSPVYFRSLPIPLPVLADVFDVRGATPAKGFDMASAYFSKDQDYLDGIGDSIAVYYNRTLHQDSLPEKLCVMWDSSSAESYNPYKEGFSTSSKETTVYCNALVSVDKKNANCSSKDGRCSNVITVGGLKLSSDVKTSGVGKVYSYSQFKDNDRDVVKQGFATTLTDRIAPIPLKAELFSMKNSKGESAGRDSLVLTLSEPVQLKTDSKKKVALEFYLKATTDVKAIESEIDPVLSEDGAFGKVRYVYNSEDLAPSEGDYVRLKATADKVYWADLVDLGKDTVRAATSYNWNSPTAYNEKDRLPSPWVAVVKAAAEPDSGKKQQDNPGAEGEEFAEPSFRVRMVGPFQFAIVIKEPAKALKKDYMVMDLQGRVVAQGNIASVETVVPVLSKGSYVVKVGLGMRRVNLH